MEFSVVQCNAIQFSSLQCSAVHCSAVQCSAMLQVEGMLEARSVLRLGSELGVRGPRRVFQIEVKHDITGELTLLPL